MLVVGVGATAGAVDVQVQQVRSYDCEYCEAYVTFPTRSKRSTHYRVQHKVFKKQIRTANAQKRYSGKPDHVPRSTIRSSDFRVLDSLRGKCFQRMYSVCLDANIRTAAAFRTWEIAWQLREGLGRVIVGGKEEGNHKQDDNDKIRRSSTRLCIPKYILVFEIEMLPPAKGRRILPMPIVPISDNDVTKIRRYLLNLGTSGLRLFEKPSHGGIGLMATRQFMR